MVVPPPMHQNFRGMVSIKTTALQRLLNQFWRIQLKTQADMLTMWMEVNSALHKDEIEEQKKTLRALITDDEEVVRARLKDDNPLYRLGAAQSIQRRRLHLEKDLLKTLEDPQPLVRETAHQGLVRLARSTDFGPKPRAGRLELNQSVRRWKAWLAMQSRPDEVHEEPVPTDPAEAEAIRLAVELAQAKPDLETAVLKRLQSAAEPSGTLALAVAIAELDGKRQAKARQALAERLAVADTDVLKQRLTDPNIDIRRAAVTAVGLKKASTLLPDALKLLEDPQVEVAQAARVALRQLTKQDFGPTAGANSIDRTIAIGQWYRWWIQKKKSE
jgi:HEAT repeat protein